MPLVEYVGNASPEDNTEAITLHQDAEGNPRSIELGKRALLSGQEFVAIAANYEVRVVADTSETDPTAIPTEMPDGYDENGYKEGEGSAAVFGPDTHPDDGSAAEAAAPAPSSAPASSPPPVPPLGPPASGSSSTPASPGASG